jgi:glycosyltransferase involved in cell wall biosynthesis
LYYPPCNTPKSAIYRDLAIIGCTRFLFKRLIYHFHAAGISESIPKLHPIERWLALKILMKPDMTITSSPYNPEDGVFLKCKNNKIIPLGIPDEIPCRQQTIALQSGTLEILFLGLLNGTKGEGYLVEAISILNLKGLRVHVRIAGTFESQEYRTLFFNKVNDLGISNQVSYLGVVTGQAKLNAFAASDLLCFPSFFESESFGVVLLEAMQAGIPIVASRWRGIQSAIEDGENGYLVNPKDAEDLAEKIERFFSNPKLIYELGLNGRKLYENKYRLEHHIKALNNAFLDH